MSSHQAAFAADPQPEHTDRPRLPGTGVIARLRPALTAVVLLAATAFLARFLHRVTPVGDWLLWDLLRLWGWLLLLSVASAAAGHLLIGRVLRLRQVPALERWAVAGPAGLVVFAAGMYLAGFLRLYGPVFAVLWPLALVTAGARSLTHELRAAWLAWTGRRPASALVLVVTVSGALGLSLLYLGLLSPQAVNYDAAWMHLTIAQDYAREGRVVPFPGDWVKNVPHLASVLYTWGFLVPGFEHPAQRWMMALHIELSALLWTLVAIASAVRFLVGDRRVRGAWTVLLLFPGIFVYDSNLGGAADHVAAAFAVPAYLTAARLLDQPRGPRWLLFGGLAGAALLTKLQMLYVLGPLAVVLLVGLGRAAFARPATFASLRWHSSLIRVGSLLLWPLAGLLCALALLALHFGKNWVHFGNPFHPFIPGMVQAWLPGSAGPPDTAVQVSNLLFDRSSQAPAELGERLRSSLEVLISFPFVPHYSFVNNKPVFGPLFSLSLLLVPLVRAGRRLWLGAALAVAMVFWWAATYRVDRNLQVFMPLLAAVTGALLWRAWQLGILCRIAVGLLVGLQVVWGADLMFSSPGGDRLVSSIGLIRSGFDGQAARRYDDFRRGHVELGRVLPAEAVVLLHTMHRSLGIDRRVVLDWMGFQGLIDYRGMRGARDLHDRLTELGVTHVVTMDGNTEAPRTRQEEIVFAAFLRHAKLLSNHHGLRLHLMPAEPPPRAAEEPLVLVLGLANLADGLYHLGDLGTCEALPPELRSYPPPRQPVLDLEHRWQALGKASAALIGNSHTLDAPLAERLGQELQSSSSPAGFSVHVRVGRL